MNLTVEAMTKNAHDVSMQLKQQQNSKEDMKHLEERFEVELSQSENLLNVLLSMSNRIQSHCDSSYLTDQDSKSLVRVINVIYCFLTLYFLLICIVLYCISRNPML